MGGPYIYGGPIVSWASAAKKVRPSSRPTVLLPVPRSYLGEVTPDAVLIQISGSFVRLAKVILPLGEVRACEFETTHLFIVRVV